MLSDVGAANALEGAAGIAPGEVLADGVALTAKRLGISLTQIYDELKFGRMIGRKVGRRTLIERAEQVRWLQSLPVKRFSARGARL